MESGRDGRVLAAEEDDVAEAEKEAGERKPSYKRKHDDETGSSTLGVGHERSRIVIRRRRVVLPDGLSLRQEEILALETLSERL